ncbi:restriction endonuclease subunit S [Clostridium sp. OM02-18AC]|uniref:restriction endonuclease subunit S n=1 Tax=Clostridium sp. OM02-18AC TaxID=2292311 RepID=UPI000E4B2946|nr:restriction endonuclease subunit S [Clostridium sp. OM02-18AC]RHV69069.1 restriction endonuclease subunit S [Clostridium sp. OM02-18AC]
MDTKALRQKILDLAIRGKLVPQDPNDEPASVLLERIREQKQQMVKDGKLKKKDIKNDSVIFVGEDNLHYEKFADGSVKCIEDEIPFELPDGWAWARLGTVAEAIGDGDHQPPPQTSSGIPFLVISNVSGGALSFENTRFVSIEYFNRLPETRKPRNGDLLFTVTGSYGIPILVDTDDMFCFQRHIAIVRPCTISNRYLYVILGSSYVKSICDAKATGTAQKTVGLATLRELLIPVAPHTEQMRIYAKTQNALNIVDGIFSDKEALQNIIKNTKAKILDLAIRGKLVPQDPNDELASVLLERIRAEKEELIKQGKIKRDKKESVIFKGEDNSYYLNDSQITVDINDELPFKIPTSWYWVRLKDVFIINPRNKLEDDLNVSFIPMPLIDDGYSGKHTSEVRSWKEVKTGFTHFAEGDIGIAKITPCFENRKSTVFINLTNGYGAGTTELHILRPIGNSILSQYLLAYLKSDYFVDNGKQTFTGAVGQQRIGKEYIENAYFPIPPKSEQERIVQIINNLFKHLNVISDSFF